MTLATGMAALITRAPGANGYATHAVGKWHNGPQVWASIPVR